MIVRNEYPLPNTERQTTNRRNFLHEGVLKVSDENQNRNSEWKV